MVEKLTDKERVLKFLKREKTDKIPCFSGMGAVLADEVEKKGWHFGDAHRDPHIMAESAAMTYPATGYPVACIPYDYHYEAEAIGSEVEFYEERRELQRIIYPIILHEICEDLEHWDINIIRNTKVAEAGRIPMIVDALHELKKLIGEDIPVSVWTLGPYGVGGAIDTVVDLSKTMIKNRPKMKEYLAAVADFISEENKLFRKEGADYVTCREMTCAVELLHPEVYKEVIVPPLQRVMAQTAPPLIIHTCGDMDMDMPYFIRTGADFLSVEQKCHIWRARQIMNGTGIRLLGNIDVFLLLSKSNEEDVAAQVKTIVHEGIDACWPSCDIWPEAPAANIKAMVDATYEWSDPENPFPGTYWARDGVWEASHYTLGVQTSFPHTKL